MTAYRRNILVGITVIVALVGLGWMILTFGGRSLARLVAPEFPVTVVTPRADGLSEGSFVAFRGVPVGRVMQMRRLANQEEVAVDIAIDRGPPLPGNLEAVIRSQGLVGGGARIDLELINSPQGVLRRGQVLRGRFVGLDILPPEFADLARELRLTARQFRESNLIPHVDETVRSLGQQVEKAGRVLDSVQSLVSDPKMREDIRASIRNLHTVTESATRIGASLERVSAEAETVMKQARGTLTKADAHVDAIARSVGDRLTQVAGLLESFQAISNKINNGEGTVGRFMNDTKLYQSLLDTSRELNATISDLRRLVEQWEQEGVSLKLK